jgi:hypothetical protein
MMGLWHNGWCSFLTAHHPDSWGYGYSGTEAEALAGQAQFVKEGMPASEYAVAPFDHLRDPIVRPGKPSTVQLAAMQAIGINRGPYLKATYSALLNHGWICNSVTAEGQQAQPHLRLTAAGRKFLELSTP